MLRENIYLYLTFLLFGPRDELVGVFYERRADIRPVLLRAGWHSLPRGVRLVFHGRPELDLWVALTPGGCQIGYMAAILAIHTACHTALAYCLTYCLSYGDLPAKERGEKCPRPHRARRRSW